MHACSLTLCLTFDLQVIAPEEIVDPDVDEHSVMTYLSQFPKAKLKPGAPVKPKQLHPKKANAYGPGGSRPKSLIYTKGRYSGAWLQSSVGMRKVPGCKFR